VPRPRPHPARTRGARSPVPRGRDAAPDAPLDGLRLALLDGVRVERLALTFKALGDPGRSRLVLALSIREMCVTDLATALGASLSATSHQLRILRDLDIVRVRRVGRSQLYALNEQAFGFCAPRVCGAWKQTLERDALVRPAEGRVRARRGRHV